MNLYPDLVLERAQKTFRERLDHGQHFIKKLNDNKSELTSNIDRNVDNKIWENRPGSIVDLFCAEKNQSIKIATSVNKLQTNPQYKKEYTYTDIQMREIYQSGYLITSTKAQNNHGRLEYWNAILSQYLKHYNPSNSAALRDDLIDLKNLGQYDALLYMRKQPLMTIFMDNHPHNDFALDLKPLDPYIFNRIMMPKP